MDSDETRAGAAARDELRRKLSSAPANWLRGAIDNPELGPAEVLLLLRNSAAPSDLLERIGKDRRLTSHQEVRSGLARHARTPPSISRNLLSHLYWKDWIDIAAAPAANPVIRRQAEQMLLTRLARLSLGERIALARRATRGLIPGFMDQTHPRVVRALLENPRLAELDVVSLAGNVETGPEALECIAMHSNWGARRSVRLELIVRTELPAQTGLRLAHQLDPRDQRVLVEDDRVPLVVRVWIERRLGKNPRARDDSDGAGEWG